MKALFAMLLALALVFPASAAKRTKVVVQKQYPPYATTQPVPPPIAVAAFIVPPLAVFYDLNRRFNCLNPPDPLGLGGPGFDGKPTPPTNVMIPCYERRYLAGQPAPR